MLEALVADIQADFLGDDNVSLVGEAYATRCAERSLPLVATDVDVHYLLDDDTVTPDMPDLHRELWLLRAKILVCQSLRARASQRISFSSGDKKMDRSKEASNWADLEKAFAAEYASRVRRVNPAADDSVISLSVTPRVYKQAKQLYLEGTTDNIDDPYGDDSGEW